MLTKAEIAAQEPFGYIQLETGVIVRDLLDHIEVLEKALHMLWDWDNLPLVDFQKIYSTDGVFDHEELLVQETVLAALEGREKGGE